ncbi:hypothetical protein I316_02115 [Kwoniella heveanensis BCC8398]|uniref:DUF1445 domain-containing protein n=1 Tax=Kwoniella heveanensis BCC8398 TaxID=1296120 RepID=A0A1B9GYZ6_9TREE|nr:hypothetical protein I316_02115 [Kwoniella heveanensis BCC8398]
MAIDHLDKPSLTPSEVRSMCRTDQWPFPATASCSDGYVQANLIVLPEKFASDFRTFCKRNPVPCPLLGETLPGDPTIPASLAKAADIRTDCPSYCLYSGGKYLSTVTSTKEHWKEDSVGFFIGCSYSFEGALIAAGLVPRHVELGTKVPMYRTTVPLASAGVFSGTMVVSMRPYPASAIPQIIALTRPYSQTHGEPFAYGPEGAAALGITDKDGTKPDFGDASEIREGEVAVYWGCGVTPQNVVMGLGDKIDGIVMGHEPGQMLILDLKNADLCETDL